MNTDVDPKVKIEQRKLIFFAVLFQVPGSGLSGGRPGLRQHDGGVGLPAAQQPALAVPGGPVRPPAAGQGRRCAPGDGGGAAPRRRGGGGGGERRRRRRTFVVVAVRRRRQRRDGNAARRRG
jgi:hypothetical protein